MRQPRKWLAVMTTAGLLVAAASAGADGIGQKISGWLRPDIIVAVDGAETGMKPVIIEGKAYLPARGIAEATGYEIHWKGNRIELSGAEDEEQYMTFTGYINGVTQDGDRWRIDVIGPDNWLILYADKETVLTDAEGKPFAAEDLAPGMAIEAEYGPMVAMSYPAQSHAASIKVMQQHLVAKQVIHSVEKTEDGWRIGLADEEGGEVKLVLLAGPETLIVRSDKQPADAELLEPGLVVRAYYGPAVMKSLPPQSHAQYIEVDDQREWLAPAEEQEYRELAWKQLSDEDKAHLITAKDEALVELIDAANAAVIPLEGKERLLEDIRANGGKLVAVTYKTDQDALLGPVTVLFDPETKEVIGHIVRM
ncbi:hypothetical protein Theco_0488 [Thermobacillus composti KWC4]|uniref:Copper amine oxidase-like N-terminal domain-containing protein n=1 Tax=Thermobacillus composti (strain DSM 18247 / JCM 13945 / KWC4) TaxID=717605 RepID=L0E8T0_THECK|nr:hypothetical protein [Thermobacillus composti]AGA56703.1 hypothetical protein Theco_0488 [Thermobacillus composti KWC4]